MLQRGLFGMSGLAALAGLALALGNVPRACAADDPTYFHLNATIFELREAKEDVRNLKGLNDNARDKTLGSIDAAIDQMKKCLGDLGVEYKYVAPEKDPYPSEDKDYKHLRHAIREMKEAKGQLRAVKGISDEHRDNALAAMDKATEQLKDALDSAK